ncbi:P-loop containing nucleoside triphosphate hydrolase protein [Atractiella rhizophila]|nr:P-loop containing nucleoside triphosphate hydrolase protein [Atractiella rhizophila]
MSLDSLPLDRKRCLRRAGYSSASSLLLSPPAVIAHRAGLPVESIRECLSLISKPFIEEGEVKGDEEEWLGTGDAALDELLGGGLRIGTVLDIAGESGSGKSTLAAHLTIATSQANHSSLLLFTESRAPPISNWASILHPSLPNITTLTDRVSILALPTLSVFENLLDFRLHSILSSLSPPPRLLIIDSLSALLRTEFGTGPGELKKRKECLGRIAEALGHAAQKFGLAVVTVNQVADVFEKPIYGQPIIIPSVAGTGGKEEIPSLHVNHQLPYFDGRTIYTPRTHVALGPIWADHCDARLILARTDRKMNDGEGTLKRRMEVVFSPFVRPGGRDFVIDGEGLRVVQDDDVQCAKQGELESSQGA